jgi:hypothetical protein
LTWVWRSVGKQVLSAPYTVGHQKSDVATFLLHSDPIFYAFVDTRKKGKVNKAFHV